MAELVAWLAVAVVLGLIGWGMFALTRRAARTRVTAGRRWLPLALALAPAAFYAVVILNFLAGVLVDPTSNNLWPLIVAFLLALWLAYALALRLLLGIAGLLFARGD